MCTLPKRLYTCSKRQSSRYNVTADSNPKPHWNFSQPPSGVHETTIVSYFDRPTQPIPTPNFILFYTCRLQDRPFLPMVPLSAFPSSQPVLSPPPSRLTCCVVSDFRSLCTTCFGFSSDNNCALHT